MRDRGEERKGGKQGVWKRQRGKEDGREGKERERDTGMHGWSNFSFPLTYSML